MKTITATNPETSRAGIFVRKIASFLGRSLAFLLTLLLCLPVILLPLTTSVPAWAWTLRGRWPRQTLERWKPAGSQRMSRAEWIGLALAGVILLGANVWEALQIVTRFG